MSRIENVRETRSEATTLKLQELITILRKILSPNDLLKMINDFVWSKGSDEGEGTINDLNAKMNAVNTLNNNVIPFINNKKTA